MTAGANQQAKMPHKPVLLTQVLEALAPKDRGIYVDGTFGAGGYSRAILAAADTRVYGIDQDPNTFETGKSLAHEMQGRFTMLPGRFSRMDELLSEAGVDLANGVVLDIGVSSMQLDEAVRGFSFMADGPLDMRMSQVGMSAADVVNDFAINDLKRIIKTYGEEKRAHAIAAAIGRARKEKQITRTRELAQLIEKTIGTPPGPRKTIHPATRTFQALRIFVNRELDELIKGLSAAEKLLCPGGRLVVVTFHSLEDRIVKKFLTKRTGNLPNPSRHAPAPVERTVPSFRALQRSGVSADETEINQNPRARSARLRYAERTAAAPIRLDDNELAQGRLEGLSC